MPKLSKNSHLLAKHSGKWFPLFIEFNRSKLKIALGKLTSQLNFQFEHSMEKHQRIQVECQTQTVSMESLPSESELDDRTSPTHCVSLSSSDVAERTPRSILLSRNKKVPPKRKEGQEYSIYDLYDEIIFFILGFCDLQSSM